MPMYSQFVGPADLGTSRFDVQQNATVINNPAIRRPFFDKKDVPRVIVNTGGWTVEKGVRVPIKKAMRVIDLIHQGNFDPVLLSANATSLRKEQWQEMDRVVLLAYRQRLMAWADLAAANTFGGFNGMNRMTLEYEAMSDPGEAVVDFDALSEGTTDSPLFKLRSLPLPITHSDFWFSERRLGISGNNGTPFDVTMAEAGARRIGESIERSTIGTVAGPTYGTVTAGPGTHDGTSTVYGYLTHPDRVTKTDMTAPTAGGWVPDTTYNQVLTVLKLMKANGLYGPFQMYYSPDWFEYMNRQYAIAGGNNQSTTLQKMLEAIPGIKGVKELDFMTGQTFTMIFVQMTSDVARAVNGLDVTTVMWPSQGGMRLNFKTMCIKVPQIRSDFTGKCGVCVATTS